jgi:4,5:9,10-diseco-3-hydroxy-5,9,17-trioxoandrosta-1(10),2-diene-4-oate hydrolase
MATEQDLVSKLVPVDGADLHYLEFGQGPMTVFIHGSGAGASGISNFRRNLPIAHGRRVIIIDLPGYGRSPTRSMPGGIYEAMAGWVTGLMDALSIPRASFVGNSLGGGIALRIALDTPERVDKLVLMGCGGSLPIFSVFPSDALLSMINFYEGEGPTIEKLRAIVAKLVFDPSFITDDLLRERLEIATRPDVLENPPLRGRGYNPKDDLWRDDLYKLDHQTLLIWGREDRVIPIDAAFLLLKLLRRARLHVFPQCGHWAQLEKADEFNVLVDSFLPKNNAHREA